MCIFLWNLLIISIRIIRMMKIINLISLIIFLLLFRLGVLLSRAFLFLPRLNLFTPLTFRGPFPLGQFVIIGFNIGTFQKFILINFFKRINSTSNHSITSWWESTCYNLIALPTCWLQLTNHSEISAESALTYNIFNTEKIRDGIR